MRNTLGQDAAQARALGLSWADGDRVTTLHLPYHDCATGQTVRRWEWWASFRVPGGVVVRRGVEPTIGKARAAIAAAVGAR